MTAHYIAIGVELEDGSVAQRLWEVTRDLAERVASRLGPPTLDHVLSAEEQDQVADIAERAAVPIVVWREPA
jgi:hypothetical protein